MSNINAPYTAHEILHGDHPEQFNFQEGVQAYPEGLFPSSLSGLPYTPVFSIHSIEDGDFPFYGNEEMGLFFLDCLPVARIVELAKDPLRLARVRTEYLRSLFVLAEPAFVRSFNSA